MNLEIPIQVITTIKLEFEINPNKKVWNSSTNEQKTIYIKQKISEEITDNLDVIVDGIIADSKFLEKLNKQTNK
jgi:hypothetical protein